MNRRAYLCELLAIVNSLPQEKQMNFVTTFQQGEKNPVIALGLNTFLGTLGADRFYLGQTGWGILKLCTLGGFGIWVIVDYFLAPGLARDKSIGYARALKLSFG